MRLKGKTAIVTGGGTGIGRAIATEFARQGAYVVIAGIDPNDVDDAVEEIRKEGGEAVGIPTDVSKSEQVQQLVNQVISLRSRIDVLVNNAAIQLYGTAETMDEADWDAVINVNLKGPFLCTKYVLPHMKKQKSGSIINIGSVTGLVGTPNLIAYSAAKGGLHAMTRAAAIEFAKEGIRINAIAPGTVNTPILKRHLQNQSPDPEKAWQEFNAIHPIGRVAEPHEIAMACVYLASDESSFTTGTTLVVDGGYTVQGFLP